MLYRLSALCHFGIESVLKREIMDLGYEIDTVEDGRVIFKGDALAVCKSNIWLRTAERVMITVGEFNALTFEELFQNIKKISWEEIIPENGRFWVKKASSIKSKLFSTKDIQSIVKKAMVERMKEKYKINWFEESGNDYPVRVLVNKDKFYVDLDTSGDSLHKRGYRPLTSEAPISETLAAAIIKLSPWKMERELVDLFCGSGTIPIEAAMIGANIAPGLKRNFVSQGFTNVIDKSLWDESFSQAKELEKKDIELDIQGYDIDDKVLKVARKNAILAGVEKYIHFQQRDALDFSTKKKYGVIISNPPFGERILDEKQVKVLYGRMGKVLNPIESWTKFIITSYEDFENTFGRKSTKKRKLYTGMMKADLYQYWGDKPKKF